MVRCVGSIGANIEEGYGRGFGKEYPLTNAIQSLEQKRR